MSETKPKREKARARSKALQAVDLFGNMRLRDARDFAALLLTKEPQMFDVVLTAMRGLDLLLKAPAATKPAPEPACHGCKRGYDVCEGMGIYGTPSVPSDRCSTCHHNATCHGR
jgi:hypothetical protein